MRKGKALTTDFAMLPCLYYAGAGGEVHHDAPEELRW